MERCSDANDFHTIKSLENPVGSFYPDKMVSTIVTFSLDKRSRGRPGSRNFIASFAEIVARR